MLFSFHFWLCPKTASTSFINPLMCLYMKYLKDEDYKKIIARRDPRYDGRFYFGVKTTKIYCRPICPARPKPENILIFKSQSEAEKSGYRPCLRCHSDLAPDSKILMGTANTVSRALRLIDEFNTENLNVESLAESLGMTSRHLRRLFDEHLGASPIEIITTKRLHMAKQWLEYNTTSISTIAFAVGFNSIRRFNEAFKALYKLSPSDFRKKYMQNKKKSHKNFYKEDEVHLRLLIRPPYDWNTVLAYLKRHETYGIEKIIHEEYWRFIPQNSNFAYIRVTMATDKKHLNVYFSGFKLTEIRPALLRVKSLFDVDHNPRHLPVQTKALSIRVPGHFCTFETAVSIIISQLISTEQAKAKMKSLIQNFGRKICNHEGSEVYEFPQPAQLMEAPLEKIGLSKMKSQAIRDLAMQMHKNKIFLNPKADLKNTKKQLLSIKGIGPWTCEMISMRCLGDTDAYPKNDLIVKKALEQKKFNEEIWSSSRAYGVHYLWRDAHMKNKKGKSL